jgi:hypothetical protein
MRRREVTARHDTEWIAAGLQRWDRSRRLSLRGKTPSPKLVRGLLDEHVALQQAVWTDDGRPTGLFQVTELRAKDGFGQLDLLVDPTHAHSFGPALQSFLSEAFQTLPLRKLCLWGCEDELAVPSGLSAWARQVGRLVGHERRGPDDYADMLVYEVWKDDLA